MPEIYRGEKWGAYYRMDVVTNPSRLFGQECNNANPVGTYVDADGVLQGVSFVVFYKDIDLCPNAPDGKVADAFDLSNIDADFFVQDQLFQLAMSGVEITPEIVETATWPHPIVKQMVLADLAEGLTGPEIFEKRAGVLNYRFLGFTLADALSANPSIWQPTTDENGNEIPNLVKCSLEDTVNV